MKHCSVCNSSMVWKTFFSLFAPRMMGQIFDHVFRFFGFTIFHYDFYRHNFGVIRANYSLGYYECTFVHVSISFSQTIWHSCYFQRYSSSHQVKRSGQLADCASVNAKSSNLSYVLARTCGFLPFSLSYPLRYNRDNTFRVNLQLFGCRITPFLSWSRSYVSDPTEPILYSVVSGISLAYGHLRSPKRTENVNRKKENILLHEICLSRFPLHCAY